MVRCFCGEQINSADYVQCELCHTWQHFECVGFDPIAEENKRYICPLCSEQISQRTDIGATLIVCPDTILTQWLSEIKKHAHRHLYIQEYSQFISIYI